MSIEEIGTNAGVIYRYLFQRGNLSLRKIGELTNKKESVIYLSIGWLLREDKIEVYLKDGEWHFEPK